jgi:UDPglucose 6-dehydrogenase
MNVVIIGAGVVGRATGKAMEAVDHEVEYFDPPAGLHLSISQLAEAELAMFCVPTPYKNLEAIKEALCTANERCGPDCIFIIKSTVPPNFTDETHSLLMPERRLIFSPEFLTEATAEEDAMHPPRLVLGYPGDPDGPSGVACLQLKELLPRPSKARWSMSTPSRLEEGYFIMRAVEAELLKLWTNTFYAAKVTLANQLFDIADALGVDYGNIRGAIETDPMIAAQHLDVHHKGYRGYAGKCLPKDVNWMITAMEQAGCPSELLVAVQRYNHRLGFKS